MTISRAIVFMQQGTRTANQIKIVSVSVLGGPAVKGNVNISASQEEFNVEV